jgi:2-polyprenyl-3-methyl-5-hydroxy-6-metoxy-1,4-benzoquinol methylase
LLAPDWDLALGDRLFDWVLSFAVFHHLPGAETRTAVLGALAKRLAPGGWLAMSNWQFVQSERLRRRVAAWEVVGLEAAEVEPGDYLLTWARGPRRGLRYVHVLDEAEARALAPTAGLAVREVFRADGVSGDLAEYVLMQTAG